MLMIVGELLYGERWQAAIARDLDVSLRTVQRWNSGEKIAPQSWLDERLEELLIERRTKMDEQIDAMQGLRALRELSSPFVSGTDVER